MRENSVEMMLFSGLKNIIKSLKSLGGVISVFLTAHWLIFCC